MQVYGLLLKYPNLFIEINAAFDNYFAKFVEYNSELKELKKTLFFFVFTEFRHNIAFLN